MLILARLRVSTRDHDREPQNCPSNPGDSDDAPSFEVHNNHFPERGSLGTNATAVKLRRTLYAQLSSRPAQQMAQVRWEINAKSQRVELHVLEVTGQDQ